MSISEMLSNSSTENNNPVIVFKISRFKAETKHSNARFNLMERYNAKDDAVKSMARVVFEDCFISGLHLAFKDAEGNVSFSFDKDEELKDIYQDFNISLTQAQTDKLLEDVMAIPKLAKPPKNENGVSTLRGYQLQVVLHTDDGERYSKADNHYTIAVESSNVKEVKIVTQSNPEYIKTYEAKPVKIGNLISLTHNTQERSQEIEAEPETREEAIAMLRKLTRAEKRSNARKAAQAKKAASTNSDLDNLETLDATVVSEPEEVTAYLLPASEDNEDDESYTF